MATPITWQNINGPSLAEASRPLDSAVRAFDFGFSGLRSVLDQRNQIDDQNFQTTIKNNTNKELNRLTGIEDIGAFKAAKTSLGQALDGYGATIDQDRLRQFADQRVSVLQQRQKQALEFDHMMKNEETRPIAAAYKMASVEGNKEGMAAALAQYQKLGGLDLPGLVEYGDARGWLTKERGETETEWKRRAKDQLLQEEAHRDALKTSAQTRAASAQQILASKAQIAAAAEQRGYTALDRLTKNIGDLTEQESGMSDPTLNSKGAMDSAVKYIKSLTDNPKAQESMISAVGEVIKDGQIDGKPVTLSVLQQALTGAKDNGWFWNYNHKDSLRANLKTLTSAPGYVDRIAAQETKRSVLSDQVADLRDQSKRVLTGLVAQAAPGVVAPPEKRKGNPYQPGSVLNASDKMLQDAEAAEQAAKGGKPAAPAGRGAPASSPGAAASAAITAPKSASEMSPAERAQLEQAEAESERESYGRGPQGVPVPGQKPAAAATSARVTSGALMEAAERRRMAALAEVDKQFPGNATFKPEAAAARNLIAQTYMAEKEQANQVALAEDPYAQQIVRNAREFDEGRKKAASARARDVLIRKQEREQERQNDISETQAEINMLESRIANRSGGVRDPRLLEDAKEKLRKLQNKK